jgi:hypothetical protein
MCGAVPGTLTSDGSASPFRSQVEFSSSRPTPINPSLAGGRSNDRFWPVATCSTTVTDGRIRMHTGHGRSCCRLEPVADDPFRNSKRLTRVVRLSEVWWHESLMV